MRTSQKSGKLDDLLHNSKTSGLTLRSCYVQANRVIDYYQDENVSNEFFQDYLTRAKHQMSFIDMGVHDAEILQTMNSYLDYMSAERDKYRLMLRKMADENLFLKEEVTRLQRLFTASEERVVQLEVEREQVNFMNDLTFMTNNINGNNGNAQTDLQVNNTMDDLDALLTNNADNELKTGDSETDSVMGRSQMSSSGVGGGSDLPLRMRTLHNLVINYASQGRYEVAVPLCKQALEDLERTSGHNHPHVATMLNILAMVYRDQGNYRQAADLLQDALEIREKALGSDHPAVAATLNNIAVLYGKKAKYREAEPLCKRALVIREKTLGSDHPDVAKQLNNLALLCQNQNKMEEAEFYYQRALEIYTQVYGENDGNVGKTKVNLAAAYLKQSKYTEAEELYKDVLNKAHRKVSTESNVPGAVAGAGQKNIKTLWELAEEKEAQTIAAAQNKSKTKPTTSSSTSTTAAASAAVTNSPIVNLPKEELTIVVTAMKNLAALYRRNSKFSAAEFMDEFTNQFSVKPSQSKINIPMTPAARSVGASGPNSLQRMRHNLSRLLVGDDSSSTSARTLLPSRHGLQSKTTRAAMDEESYSKEKVPQQEQQSMSTFGRLRKATSLSRLFFENDGDNPTATDSNSLISFKSHNPDNKSKSRKDNSGGEGGGGLLRSLASSIENLTSFSFS